MNMVFLLVEYFMSNDQWQRRTAGRNSSSCGSWCQLICPSTASEHLIARRASREGNLWQEGYILKSKTGFRLSQVVRMAQSWIMMISEQHRYQGVSYKSDIIVISGEQMYSFIVLKHDLQQLIWCDRKQSSDQLFCTFWHLSVAKKFKSSISWQKLIFQLTID